MKEYVKNLFPEMEVLWPDIEKVLITKTVPAKTTLLYEGDVAQNLYLIKKGAVRLWHNDDGRDVTLQFFLEGQLVSSFESFYLAIESQYSIECLEECTILVLSKESLFSLMEQYSDIKDVLTRVICTRFIDYTSFFLSRIKDSPEKRYQHLMSEQPELLERIPHHYIASYLGITPVSLSRIRNRINKR